MCKGEGFENELVGVRGGGGLKDDMRMVRVRSWCAQLPAVVEFEWAYSFSTGSRAWQHDEIRPGQKAQWDIV